MRVQRQSGAALGHAPYRCIRANVFARASANPWCIPTRGHTVGAVRPWRPALGYVGTIIPARETVMPDAIAGRANKTMD